jgi:murein DD-endopeptidase MepM/ murein hydrolase activator NlpD
MINWKKTGKILMAAALLVGGALAAYLLLTPAEPSQTVPPGPVADTLFGIPVDSFHIVKEVVRPNQNLGDILTGFGVSMTRIDQLARKAENIFDVRKIRTGQPYYLFQSPDTSREARFMVYENNRIEYVIFDLSDSLTITQGRKKVRAEHRSASGTITSNLWNTMTDNNLNPALAIEMSEIYAWTIDFFGIQKGDRFRLLFIEQYVDSTSIGVGPIYAAEFEHMGKSYYAFRFSQDEGFDYFDDRGENLRKAFLKAPLSFSRISSRFSGSRLHPVLKIRRPHFGVDYAAPKGTPVMTIGDGTVVERGYKGGGGNTVKIKHNTVYTTLYLHLSGFAKGITPGARVRQGDVIGYVGSTGLSTGPHLDFRVYKNGSPVDPLKLDVPPGEPVKAAFKPDFTTIKDSLTTLLYKINWQKDALSQ